jgi:hypothetical protein
MNHIKPAPCGCEILGTGTVADPLHIQFCGLHQPGGIVVALVRLEHLKTAIVSRNCASVEFQFDRVLRALTKQQKTQL